MTRHLVLIVLVAWTAATCGGGGDGGTNPPVIATVTIAGGTEQLNFVGDTLQYSATAADGGGSNIPGKTFTWSSGNTAFFTVVLGPATTTTATAVANGTANVTATVDGVTGSRSVTVSRKPASAALDPNTFPKFTAFGQTQTAGCVVKDSADVQINNHPCNWSASVSGIVTFTPAAGASTTITAVGNGSTGISATAATNVTGFNSVEVEQVPVSIKLHPQTIDTSRILASAQMQFEKPVKDANGFAIDTATVAWTTSNAAWTVSLNGLATAPATAPSNTYVKATYAPLAGSGNEKDSSYVEAVGAPITLSGSAQPIFTASCASAGCHAPPGQQGLILSAGQTFSETVNVTARQSALRLVLPSRPDSSYLVHKIQGTHLGPPANGSGSRMPEGCTVNCLTRAQINRIRNWILQGAQNN